MLSIYENNNDRHLNIRTSFIKNPTQGWPFIYSRNYFEDTDISLYFCDQTNIPSKSIIRIVRNSTSIENKQNFLKTYEL